VLLWSRSRFGFQVGLQQISFRGVMRARCGVVYRSDEVALSGKDIGWDAYSFRCFSYAYGYASFSLINESFCLQILMETKLWHPSYLHQRFLLLPRERLCICLGMIRQRHTLRLFRQLPVPSTLTKLGSLYTRIGVLTHLQIFFGTVGLLCYDIP
jgi:hypothetical protein